MNPRQFQSFVLCSYFLCVNSLFEVNNQYVDVLTLKNTANSISNAFRKVGYYFRESDVNYKASIRAAMNEVVESMSLYDRPFDRLDYLNTANYSDGFQHGTFKSLTSVVFDLMVKIDSSYQRFKNIAHNLRNGNQSEITTGLVDYRNITNWSIDLDTLVTYEDPSDNSTFLQQVFTRATWIQDNLCNDHIPPKQYIMFQIYVDLVSSHLKAFAVEVFNRHCQFSIGRSLKLEQNEKKIGDLLVKLNEMLDEDNSKLKSWIVWDQKIGNCEPKILERDVNFIELERVFQLVFVPERSSMEGHLCWGGCDSLNGMAIDPEYCTDNGYCVSCQGQLRNCRNAVQETYACLAKKNDSRRFHWFTTHDGISVSEYGMTSSSLSYADCRDDGKQLYPSLNKYVIGGICEFCMCTCEENSHKSTNSVFIISSQMSNSDVKNNMVITGIRFIKKEKIIYTQIKQGELMLMGSIDQKTDHWKPIELLDRNAVNSKIKDRNVSQVNDPFENFIVITSDLKAINLNDVYCPSENHVLTGVGLGMSKNEADTNRIALFINCHLVDFKRAHLMLNDTGPTEKIQNDRTNVQIGKQPPNRTAESYDKDSSDGYFVEFSMSDLYSDAGQSVFPWFDSRIVTSIQSIPLTGVGLHFVAGNNSGGFLAYKLFSISYFQFL